MKREFALLPCLLLLCCSERTTNLVSTKSASTLDASEPPPDEDGGGVPGFDSGVVVPPPWQLSDAGVVFCGESPCACSNGIDDDGDELIDGFDGECTGPYDQDEQTFATGEVKPSNPHCADCFFDGNDGAGDDTCNIAASCSSEGNASGAVGACPTCAPSDSCVDNCLPRTPNGCDCFGCCEVQSDDGEKFTIFLVDTCSVDDLRDPDKCPSCVLSKFCVNPCGECELCPGKTLDELPAKCMVGSGPGFLCEGGDACAPDLPCTPGNYCGQGCCQPIVL